MCDYETLTVVRQLVLPILTHLRLVDVLNLDTEEDTKKENRKSNQNKNKKLQIRKEEKMNKHGDRIVLNAIGLV